MLVNFLFCNSEWIRETVRSANPSVDMPCVLPHREHPFAFLFFVTIAVDSQMISMHCFCFIVLVAQSYCSEMDGEFSFFEKRQIEMMSCVLDVGEIVSQPSHVIIPQFIFNWATQHTQEHGVPCFIRKALHTSLLRHIHFLSFTSKITNLNMKLSSHFSFIMTKT